MHPTVLPAFVGASYKEYLVPLKKAPRCLA